MSEASLEVFQDLYLKTEESPLTIRDGIIAKVKEPWLHDEEREKSVGSKPDDARNVLILKRDESDGIEASSLVLWRKDSEYKVANIIPTKKSELGISAYNAVLNDFLTQVAEPAAHECGFTIELTAPRQTLEDWFSPESASALRSFSVLANKAVSHPLDVERWNSFLISTHRSGERMDSGLLARWLTEIEGWPDDKAIELAIEYEVALGLLKQYDNR